MSRLRIISALWLASIAVGCGSPSPSPETATVINAAPLVDSVPSFDTLAFGWVDVTQIIPDVKLDLRYATSNNFVEKQLYDCARCLLRPTVADALKTVQVSLQEVGYSLKLFDCYRPRPVQEELWETLPDPSYVTNPAKGSMHNRGAAIDVTLIDSLGQEVDMGTAFDFFGPRAYHTFTDLPDEVLAHRRLLRETMLTAGFGHIRTEWWHYSYRAGSFEISDYQWPCP